jgi:hypothetical protein
VGTLTWATCTLPFFFQLASLPVTPAMGATKGRYLILFRAWQLAFGRLQLGKIHLTAQTTRNGVVVIL